MKIRLLHLFLLPVSAAALFLSGCSKIDLLNAWVPHDGYTIHRDLAYGANPRQKLDIYVPDGVKSPAPVIVFFYGGRWTSGSKNDYRFVGQAFASRGYITVIADYRLYPDVYFPAFMNDAGEAFVWVHNHIQAYGGNAQNIYTAGHSAGAYIAALLALDKDYIARAGGKHSWISGVIGIAGPYDFRPFTDADIKAIFSKVPEEKTQPITFVKAGVPPMLLLTGDTDEDVLPRNSKNLADKLLKYNNKVTLKTYPDVAHIGIILALAEGFRNKAPVLDDVDAFIGETVR